MHRSISPTGNQTFNTSGTHDVGFPTETYDTAGNFATPSFTAPVAGIYNMCASITASTDVGLATLQFTRSVGTGSLIGSVGTATSPTVTLNQCVPFSLAASETVKVQATIGSGTTLTVSGPGNSKLSGRLVP